MSAREAWKQRVAAHHEQSSKTWSALYAPFWRWVYGEDRQELPGAARQNREPRRRHLLSGRLRQSRYCYSREASLQANRETLSASAKHKPDELHCCLTSVRVARTRGIISHPGEGYAYFLSLWPEQERRKPGTTGKEIANPLGLLRRCPQPQPVRRAGSHVVNNHRTGQLLPDRHRACLACQHPQVPSPYAVSGVADMLYP
jgi:hypothetical protein